MQAWYGELPVESFDGLKKVLDERAQWGCGDGDAVP